MIEIKQKGNFDKAIQFLGQLKRGINLRSLEKYGEEGVAALAAATPVDTGKTASSWFYEIKKERGSVSISFHNSNIQNGTPIAILIQYGHGTNNGGWVQGRDYINPSIQPIFDKIANNAWKEVTKT